MFQTMHKKWTEISGIRLLFNITPLILLHEKFLKFDWLRAVVFQLSLKYLHVKITTPLRVVVYKQIIAWFVCDIFWRKYHLWYFKIVSNFTCLTACEITYNSFEISLVVFMPNITTNHTITYTNINFSEIHVSWPAPSDSLSVPIYSLLVPSSVSQIWPSTDSC